MLTRTHETVSARRDGAIDWTRALTLAGLLLLVGAEVFAVAYAGSWALSHMLELGTAGRAILQIAISILGVASMVPLARLALRVEPVRRRGRYGAVGFCLIAPDLLAAAA